MDVPVILVGVHLLIQERTVNTCLATIEFLSIIDMACQIGWNNSDPYLEVIAYNADGNSVTRRSVHRRGDHSPDWNCLVDMHGGDSQFMCM